MIRMNGMSQTGMQAMLSAASSMKLAKVQGSTATQIKGRANVLEAEIKQDGGKGNTEKKEAELEDLKNKAQSVTEGQMSTLSDANKSMQEAAKEERKEKEAEAKAEKKAENKAKKTDAKADNKTKKPDAKKDKTDKTEKAQETNDVPKTDEAENNQVAVQPVVQPVTQQNAYMRIDIRL